MSHGCCPDCHVRHAPYTCLQYQERYRAGPRSGQHLAAMADAIDWYHAAKDGAS